MSIRQDHDIDRVEAREYPTRVRRMRESAAAAAVAAAAVLCLLAGCGSDTPPAQNTPAATTATDAACADGAELKSSLEALTKVEPKEDGVVALKTAIEDVQSKLEPAVASASEVLKPSVEQVKTAFAELQTAASNLTADNLTTRAPAIRSAMTQVRMAAAELSTTLTAGCSG